MKKFSILALVAVMLCAMSCNNGGCKVEPKGTSDSLNYYIGAFFGTMIKQQMKQGPNSTKPNSSRALRPCSLSTLLNRRLPTVWA